MSRLIDADELVKLLKASTMSNGTLINTNTMLAVVEKIPTAFDKERVVEQLQNEKERYEKDGAWWSEHSWKDSCVYNECDMNDRKSYCFEEAIDIVKKGGVE